MRSDRAAARSASDGERIGGRVYNLMLSDSDDLAVIQKSHASANDDILGPRA
jgi:hypothetical protein